MHVAGLSRILMAGLLAASSLSCGASAEEGPTTAGSSVSDAREAIVSGPAFPRTATYYLDQDRLPPVEELARYDLVVVDHEWEHRVPRSYFDDLRARNPRLLLLAYVNLVDRPDGLGTPEYWTGRYDLWRFDSGGGSTFPREWLATTASGRTVSEWYGSTMTNLTDVAPRVADVTYAEYAAEWVADSVWSAGIWDGILLDVWSDRIYTADASAWDIDGDGDDEPDSEIYGPDGPWDRGLSLAEKRMRELMPDALLVANGARSPLGGSLDGSAWESFADPLGDREPRVDVDSYLRTSSDPSERKPGVWVTIDRLGWGTSRSETYRRARFFLTATLLQDGYWAPMLLHYGSAAYYDEMDGAGLGRGYLGRPLEDGVRNLEPDRNVYRRDFEYGTVLVNVGDRTEQVRLERKYRHLQGVQDPDTNNGSITDEIVLPPQDGIVLLRLDVQGSSPPSDR
ncbi:putative glycosyl hydrolase-like family 15 (GHL15) protein [Rhodococcus rhodochrous J45]|uniref:Putative glycosyl hydrolase-like family 15 (GHL15) protein n=2 Tax=Rhodococcus rhodochrous TaxID=1829 RepID=A0A562EMB0_RHORH|nr:putative glycosyl hydrolase-like family 15 (GHL15) protein [Rhodococcus rhodochrous J45]